MGIRRNIIISLILHAVMLIATFSISYRERVFPLPQDYMVVSLLEELSENRFFEITQNNNKRHPEHSEGSKKQYSLLSVRSVPSQEILRLHLRMTADKGITGGEGTEMTEKSKDEVTLTMPRDRGANENYGGFFNEAETKTEKGGNDGYEIVGTEISEGIMPSQGTELFAVKGQLRDGVDSSVFKAIRSAIERAKSYPFLARQRGIEGTVLVSFMINKKGSPQAIRIVKSSGYQILDEEVPRMIRSASPFPGLKGEIVIPITFKLTESISER
jgi:TonB family protein